MNKYQICQYCIMDTSDPNIKFDEFGICNHCKKYSLKANKGLKTEEDLSGVVEEIKKTKEKYNCIIGLSGGVDSSTVVMLVKKLGLNPLAITLDNGWNAEVADYNVKILVDHLKLDYMNYKVDQEIFRDLQLAFLKSSTANAEIPTDHVIVSLLFKVAKEYNIKYVISGSNIVTEAIMAWGYDSKDLRYIKAIYKEFGNEKDLTKRPSLNVAHWIYNVFIRGVKYVPVLNYIDYNRQKAKDVLQKIGWKDYGLKHGESIYTRFFQNYILPTKFGIDKRKAHFSTLICSGQMTREQALEEIKKPLYVEEQLRQDKECVLGGLGLSYEEFDKIMELPIRSYQEFPNNKFLYNSFGPFMKLAKRMIIKS